MAEADRQARFGPTLAAALDRLEALIATFESHADPVVRQQVVELLQSVDAVHRAGLSRLAAYLDELDPAIRQQATAEPAVRLLLELYDLLPPVPTKSSAGFIALDDVETRPAERQRPTSTQ